ncbi:MAG: hypothetical protein OEU92_09330 [Alphaproteobacteria bacterium]|nr:hypothetical protein [Alphaproteobacteria bacterium]
MSTRKAAGIAALVALSVLATRTAGAVDVTIEPRLASGVSYYNFDLDGRVEVGDNSVDDLEFNDWLLFVGAGTTVSIDRFFIDVSGQYSFSGEDDLGLDVEAGDVAIDNLAQEVDFDRIEAAVTLGYRITERFAGYVGYRYADVDFEGSGSLGGIGVDVTSELEQMGPLVGASYIVPQTVMNGTLIVNGAVTFLDGDFSSELDAPAPIGNVTFDIDGDAVGLNGGVSWATALNDRLKLVIGGDVSSYSFKDEGDDTDFEELIARLRAEIRYSFDAGSWSGN